MTQEAIRTHSYLITLITPEFMVPIRRRAGVVRWCGQRPADEPDPPSSKRRYEAKSNNRTWAPEDIEIRQDRVERLSKMGFSTQQIADMLDITRRQVTRDRACLREEGRLE